ncbi:MAG: vitamin K epoxide reductase family protein [Patescibacteria group bacterium]
MKTQLPPLPKWVPIALLTIALIGFADATYLTVEHYMNSIPPCAIGGCEIVLTSQYSDILGFPTSLLGAAYYLLVAVLIFLSLDSKKEKYLRYALLLTPLGFLASLVFVSIMIFVLQAFCLYCSVSALTSTLLFVGALVIFKKYT